MSRLRGLLIWKMIWPNYSDCSINSNVKEIVHVTVNLCVETASLEVLICLLYIIFLEINE